MLPSVPIPSNVTLQLGETLDGLARERPYPILSRLNELRPSKMVGRWIERFSS